LPVSATIANAATSLPEEKKEQFRSAFSHVAPSMFLGALDQTIIATALPAIAGSLGGLSYLAWVVTAYLLAATVAAPLYGRMGDAFGRKRMLLWALGLFVAGSAACAIAPNLAMLIGARALQGFGGGGLMTLAQALIGEVVSPKERGRFQGWFGANFALASTIGPVVGGALSQHPGWRSIFWINIPLGLGAAAAALRVKTSAGTGICRLDYTGTTVFFSSTAALLLALSIGGHEVSWASPVLLALAGLGAAGFVLLRNVEQKSPDPLIPPDLIGEPGAGLGSTMPAAQTMIQWAAGDKRLGVGTALVSFSRSIGGVMGAALASAVLLGALQVLDPNARNILSRELASIGLSHEASQISPALIAAYRWVFLALGGLSACAAGVAWSIPDLDLAASPAKELVTHL
jgi:MFS family permease